MRAGLSKQRTAGVDLERKDDSFSFSAELVIEPRFRPGSSRRWPPADRQSCRQPRCRASKMYLQQPVSQEIVRPAMVRRNSIQAVPTDLISRKTAPHLSRVDVTRRLAAEAAWQP